jgi:hypothetical protein
VRLRKIHPATQPSMAEHERDGVAKWVIGADQNALQRLVVFCRTRASA